MTPEQLTGKVTSHLKPLLLGQKEFDIHTLVISDIKALIKAANEAGFNLHIASGFRSFDRQLSIWNGKFSGARTVLDTESQPLDTSLLSDDAKVHAIMRWSALPGASRHHWGTDFDVYDQLSLPQATSLQLEPWEYLTGHQAKFFEWMQINVEKYGFYYPYREDKGGVAPEPWHISHQVATQAFLTQLTPELLAQQLRDEPLLGKNIVLPQLESLYTRYISNLSV
ncbi:M15 family metallopeptidase [Vibrio sp.]|uniref:D-alanyl-D-alanine carboxypeptidase family protein n=1 Tax=Vibrio viridaestus TaxID=2487322 RepID=A0A3N9U4D3_9VIBR|nr:M15 family metallopeptidase [Vibrio viridaestus]MDC0611077.1 M15 family metallopeptidase [Vibrio sp.]RQW64442.1 D-alanyl-D-alanine carboxypeptidase family protein [Vibrio viridaestus]